MSALLEAVRAGDRNVRQVADPKRLRESVQIVLNFAVDNGATALVAASPAAERIVGAAMLENSKFAAQVGESDLVLIVDINFASGTKVARAARSARSAGAKRIAALIFHGLTDEVASAADCDIEQLVILHSWSHQPGLADSEATSSSGLPF